ncbi:hypothetical protein TNCV_2076151 [Trichonephila clavipes]|nr:hypothetical protein TNCV_2076151 [Trichonephila clavipes]
MEFLKNREDFFKDLRLDTALNEMLCDAREFPGEIDIPANFELTQPRHRTVLETKREEFVDEALIYAKSLCEEFEISFESQDESRGSIYLATESSYTRALATDKVILSHGQVTWTTPERASPSPNYHTTPTGGRFSSQQI